MTILWYFLTLPLPPHWSLVGRAYPPVYSEHTSFSLYLADAAVVGWLGWWLWKWAEGRRSRGAEEPSASHFSPLTFHFLLLALLFLTAFSATAAFDPRLTLFVLGRLLVAAVAYGALVRGGWEVGKVWLAVGLGTAVQASVALAQFALQDEVGLRWLGELNLDRTRIGVSIITMGGENWLRGYGLTAHPNFLGGVLATSLLLLWPAGAQLHGRWPTVAWLATLGLGMAGLLVSFSRSAWLGFGVGAAVILLFLPSRKQLWPLLLVSAAVLALFVASQRPLLGSRFAFLQGNQIPTESRSLSERQTLNQLAGQMAGWRGVGAGNFAAVIRPLVADLPEIAPQPAHNVPLLLAAELGWLGAAVWLLLMAWPPVMGWRAWRLGRLTPLALGATAALVALAVVDLFDYYSWLSPQGQLLRWSLWGLWAHEQAQV
ncbi:MAG: O-antigen ligase family protein [Chloroflexi bacterium]|nr:O-antigen ligase family protein [Chloroflexota bacterium]